MRTSELRMSFLFNVVEGRCPFPKRPLLAIFLSVYCSHAPQLTSSKTRATVHPRPEQQLFWRIEGQAKPQTAGEANRLISSKTRATRHPRPEQQFWRIKRQAKTQTAREANRLTSSKTRANRHPRPEQIVIQDQSNSFSESRDWV